MSVKITVINNKGGVGKTITSVNVARILADKGYKTLLIDLDQQANATQYLDLYDVNGGLSIQEVVFGDEDPAKVAVTSDYKNLYVIPSNTTFTNAATKLRSEETVPSQLFLKKAMKKEKNRYDYIVIDCPPTVDIVTANALSFADYAIIPINPSEFALEGINVVLNAIEKVNSFYDHDNLKVMGIVFTEVERWLNITKHIMEEAQDLRVDKFDTFIRKSTKVVESETNKIPLLDYVPTNNATKDYIQLTEEIIKKVKADE